MVCNELYDGQGLGNQLWNYVVARIIAEKQHTHFSILGKHKFKGKDFMTLDFGVPLRGGISPEGGPPYRLPTGITHYYREVRENLRDTQTDISRTDDHLFQIPPDTKFDGNCQSTKYLKGYRPQILEWLTIDDHYKSYTAAQDVCVIHMRCGDFKGLKDVFLPPSYYQNAMAQMKEINPNMKFYCITDQGDVAKSILPEIEIIGSALLGKIDQNKASHHVGGPVGIDFSLLLHAKYLIIPNSSFSWWAAYLNTNKKMVIAPKYWARYNTSDGFWSTSDIITDDFTYLDKGNKLFTPEECWAEKNRFEAAHQDDFTAVSYPDFAIPSPLRLTQLLTKERIITLKKRVEAKKRVALKGLKRVISAAKPGSSLVAIEEYRKTVKIYDIFTFFNELDLLEIRLHILDSYVDYFVIIECTETFSGNPKPLIYEQNKERFKKYHHKIIHYVTDDAPRSEADLRKRLQNKNINDLDREIITNALTSDNVPKGQLHWLKEFYQKESIKKALVGLHENDICFVGDVDEIWNPQAQIDFRRDDIFKLRQLVYTYYFNNRSSEPWAGTLVTKYKNIKNSCLNHLRTVSKTKYTYIKNGGWHFTNQGGADRIRIKLESYGHQEFNNDEIKSDLENKISLNRDFIGRGFTFWIDESDLPEYIKRNKTRYKQFFKEPKT